MFIPAYSHSTILYTFPYGYQVSNIPVIANHETHQNYYVEVIHQIKYDKLETSSHSWQQILRYVFHTKI